MGGIGLVCRATSTEHHTHIRTQYTDIRYAHTHIYTCKHIYMHRDNNTTICTQSAHRTHTIFTHTQTQQYAAHRTEYRIQHREQHRTQRTEQHREQPQHRTTHLHTHKHTQTYLILLLMTIYQKTLYTNSIRTIYKLYTYWSLYYIEVTI